MISVYQASKMFDVSADALYSACHRGRLRYGLLEDGRMGLRVEDVAEYCDQVRRRRERSAKRKGCEITGRSYLPRNTNRRNELGLTYSDHWVEGRFPAHIRAMLIEGAMM